MANLCLMARGNLKAGEESKEVNLEYLLTFTKDYLGRGLLKCVKYGKNMYMKSKPLERKMKSSKRKMRTHKDLTEVYTLKQMTLRKRKMFCKTSVMTLTNLP